MQISEQAPSISKMRKQKPNASQAKGRPSENEMREAIKAKMAKLKASEGKPTQEAQQSQSPKVALTGQEAINLRQKFAQ